MILTLFLLSQKLWRPKWVEPRSPKEKSVRLLIVLVTNLRIYEESLSSQSYFFIIYLFELFKNRFCFYFIAIYWKLYGFDVNLHVQGKLDLSANVATVTSVT